MWWKRTRDRGQPIKRRDGGELVSADRAAEMLDLWRISFDYFVVIGWIRPAATRKRWSLKRGKQPNQYFWTTDVQELAGRVTTFEWTGVRDWVADDYHDSDSYEC